MNYLPIFDIDCDKCDTTPCVGLVGKAGVRSTGKCGVCFFNDRSMVDWDQWNNPPEATE